MGDDLVYGIDYQFVKDERVTTSLMNRRICMRIAIALVVLMSFSCQPNTGEVKQQVSKLKIISYNVWYGFTKVPERKEEWLSWMKDQQPDVVSLQELNHYSPQMLTQDAKVYGHSYSVLLKEDGFPTGITSKYPIEDVRRITEDFHHGLMRVRIQQVYYYVIHLHPSNWETRKTEIALILKDIKTLAPGSKVILAGDFNTFSPLDSTYYSHGRLKTFFNERDLQFQEKNLNRGALDYSVIQEVMDFGFIDAEGDLRKSNYKFTGSFPTLIEKEGEHGDQRRLDYVFVSQNLSDGVTRAEIMATEATWQLSDHLPVVVELTME